MTTAVRPATPADSAAIFAPTYELAGFESLTHVFTATEAGLRDALFGAQPAIDALVADGGGPCA